jgi:hypothetical protein
MLASRRRGGPEIGLAKGEGGRHRTFKNEYPAKPVVAGSPKTSAARSSTKCGRLPN